MNTEDYDGLGEVMAEDAVMEWPQSGERVRGLENIRTILSTYPGGLSSYSREGVVYTHDDEQNYVLTPMFTMVKAQESSGMLLMVVRTRYPDGSDWYVVEMIEAARGKITKQTSYFAPVYEAPEWRAAYVEPMDAE
jgi:hypothetical protein